MSSEKLAARQNERPSRVITPMIPSGRPPTEHAAAVHQGFQSVSTGPRPVRRPVPTVRVLPGRPGVNGIICSPGGEAGGFRWRRSPPFCMILPELKRGLGARNVGGRLDKDTYYLNIAREVAKRGTCLRRNYGTVIVNRDAIVSTGYTGAPRGALNCTTIGSCPRQEAGAPPGQRYELCRSVHAEMNAVIHASRQECLGGIMYLVGLEYGSSSLVSSPRPCALCRRVIINAGLERIVAMDESQVYVWEVKDWISQESESLER